MTYTIDAAGWVRGTIPGLDMDYDVEVIPSTNNPHAPLSKNPPDLCLHTTEGSHVNPALDYEPQWIVGEFRVVQLHPVRCKGYSVDTQDGNLMQIECVEMSSLTLGVFVPETQNPLVALVAMLHAENLITSGIARPSSLDGLPLVLDRLPAAVNTYYRRFLAPEPVFDGVRGHVDMQDDEHWDPGSYDYPTFFAQVQALLTGGNDVTGDDIVLGWRYRMNNPTKPLPPKSSDGFEVGWHARDFAEKQGPGGPVTVPKGTKLSGTFTVG